MSLFAITITMPDRSRGRCTGIFSDGFAAVVQTLDHFPGAASVSALRIGGRP